jgi:hypothetical protein
MGVRSGKSGIDSARTSSGARFDNPDALDIFVAFGEGELDPDWQSSARALDHGQSGFHTQRIDVRPNYGWKTLVMDR